MAVGISSAGALVSLVSQVLDKPLSVRDDAARMVFNLRLAGA